LSSVRNENTLFIRYLMFILGLAVNAFGCFLTILANLGVAPWDTFHIGLQKTFGLTIGNWAQIVGAIVVILSYVLAGIKPGVPTLLNMICLGLFLDVYFWLDFVPEPHTFVQRIVVFLVGFMIMCVGIGMYLSPRLGAGPRDSFMLALHERTGWSIQKVRICIEVFVLIVGALFGGPVSIGTVLIAVFTGPLIQRTILFWEKWMGKWYGVVERRHSKAVG
jgi:uncharacterized membrane protein YczE